MSNKELDASSLERTIRYYNETAKRYDDLHGDQLEKEHSRALELLIPPFFSNAESVLDIGTGTGRSLQWMDAYYRSRGAYIQLNGIEPSKELSHLAKLKVPSANIVTGAGEQLPFEDRAFDLVTITGVLHHVENPRQVMREAFRVCRRGVIISDHNNFSFGSNKVRRIKMLLYSLNIMNAFSFVKQGFKKQGYSEEDGWWYPYSLMNDIGFLSELSECFFIAPTRRPNSKSGNILLSHSHIAIACIKG